MTTKFEQHRIDHIKLGFSTDNFISSVDNPFEIDNHILSLNYDTSDFGILNNNLYIKDNGIDHGSISGLSDNDHPQYLLVIDIDDSPVSGETEAPISSNWAYNHIIASDPHTGYRLESENHNHQSSGAQAGQLDHGLALTGLSDDDHSAYLLASDATNRTIFATNWLDLTDASATTLHKHDHGNMDGLSDNDHSQYLLITDIDDTPVDAETSAPISSNWAYDHIAAADPHTGYRLESADHTHQSAGAQAGQLDHGLALTGLSDDDHTQYALLAGRSGGQTLIGGIDAGDDLTLQSTSNGTKGSILFGTSAYDEVNNRLGIGTTTIPHGSVGVAKLAIDGTNASTAGPHIQITIDSDDYPVFQQLNWAHDSISLLFDAYYDGTNSRSSDVGSNFLINKNSDKFFIKYDSGISQGDVITWNTGIVLDTSGNVGIGTDSPSVGVEYQSNIPTKTDDKMILQGGYLSGHANEDYGFYQAYRILHSNGSNIWTAARIKAVEQSGYKGQIIFETNDGSASGDHTTTEAMRIDGSQNVGIGTSSPAVPLDVNADSIRIRTSQSPASNGTGTQGEIAWDSDFLYICVSDNVWKRVALTGSY